MYMIQDNRPANFFDLFSYSSFTIKEVIQCFRSSLKHRDVVGSQYWAAELICSGYIHRCISIIRDTMMKSTSYDSEDVLYFMIQQHDNCIKVFQHKDILSLRNNNSIRKWISQWVTQMCACPTHKPQRLPVIDPQQLLPQEAYSQMEQDGKNYVFRFWSKDDPKELHPYFNEFAYHIAHSKYMSALGWMSWIETWIASCKKEKKKYTFASRQIAGVPQGQTSHYIWVFWNIIIEQSSHQGQCTQRYVENCFHSYVFSCAHDSSSQNHKFSITNKPKLWLIQACRAVCHRVAPSSVSASITSIVQQQWSRLDSVYQEVHDNWIRQSSQPGSTPGQQSIISSSSTPPKKKKTKSNQAINEQSQEKIQTMNMLINQKYGTKLSSPSQ